MMSQLKFSLIVVCGIFLTSLLVQPAPALAPFKKAFKARYADPSDDADFQKLVRKTGCNVCHVKREPKEVRNAYGEELSKLIEGNAKERLDEARENDRKDEEEAQLLEELDAAFTKVESIKNKDHETYGARLKSLKLPVEVALGSGDEDDSEDDEQ